jgi:predicted small metal-binding protein
LRERTNGDIIAPFRILEAHMDKELRCMDVMPESGCREVIRGKDENEVMSKAAEHARTAHDIRQMTPDIENKVRGAIHDQR